MPTLVWVRRRPEAVAVVLSPQQGLPVVGSAAPAAASVPKDAAVAAAGGDGARAAPRTGRFRRRRHRSRPGFCHFRFLCPPRCRVLAPLFRRSGVLLVKLLLAQRKRSETFLEVLESYRLLGSSNPGQSGAKQTAALVPLILPSKPLPRIFP